MRQQATATRSAPRVWKRSWIALLLTLAFLAGSMGQAQAHVVKSKHWTYRSSEVCTYATTEISHGDNGYGFSKAIVDIFGKNYTVIPPFPQECKWPNSYPPGYISLKVHWDVWDGRAWQLCAWWDWKYNTGTAAWVEHMYHFARLYCGSGTYRTYAGGYVFYNSEWEGGWHPSQGHAIPTTPTRAKELAMAGIERQAPPPDDGPLAEDYPKLEAPSGPPPTAEELARMPAGDRPPDGFGPAAGDAEGDNHDEDGHTH